MRFWAGPMRKKRREKGGRTAAMLVVGQQPRIDLLFPLFICQRRQALFLFLINAPLSFSYIPFFSLAWLLGYASLWCPFVGQLRRSPPQSFLLRPPLLSRSFKPQPRKPSFATFEPLSSLSTRPYPRRAHGQLGWKRPRGGCRNEEEGEEESVSFRPKRWRLLVSSFGFFLSLGVVLVEERMHAYISTTYLTPRLSSFSSSKGGRKGSEGKMKLTTSRPLRPVHSFKSLI